MRLAIPLLLSAVLLPLSAEASSLRCGSKLVAEGSTQAETIRKCGEPISKVARTEVETTKVKEKDERFEVSQEKAVVRTIEEWTFNFGPNHFLQTVTFIDGKLRDVKSGDYGF